MTLRRSHRILPLSMMPAPRTERSEVKRFITTIFAAIAVFAPSLVDAGDGVVVVGSGGSTGVRVLDLESNDGAEVVIDQGRRRVLPIAEGPQVINDVRILPDGSHLVSGGDALGLIVTDEDGEEIFRLSRQAAFGAVATAVVGSYFSGAQPSRIVLGSDTVGAVVVRQVSSERLLLFDSTRLGESRGQHADVAVLPDNTIVVAANYPAARISSLDFLTIEDGIISKRRFSDQENLSHPADTILDPAFADIRDVHGFGGETPGDVLVVTRTRAFRLADDGTITWTVTLGDIGIGGEFAAGVVLPSGRIALASFEPGRWVDPHPNHRVAWLEPDGTFDGLVSGPLESAPVSIDALDGHGGTGTTGFTAGLEELPLGDPSLLALRSGIYVSGTKFPLGSRITVSTAIDYTGANAVSLERARVVGAPAIDASCETVDVPVIDFARDDSVTILAGESYPLSGSRNVDSVFDFGPWCVWVQVAETNGRVRRIGDFATFEVVRQGGDAGGEPIPGTTLGFGGSDSDAGMSDAGADGGGDSGNGGEGGCGCATGQSAFDASALLLLVAFFARRRRQ